MEGIDLQSVLNESDDHVADELERMPEVEDRGHDLDVSALPSSERVWHKVTEAVAVVADLKSSTQLGLNKNARSTASIYEAATGNVAEILYQFEADFIAVQGDGAFGLFWGDGRKRRAICAAITLQTFGVKSLVPRLNKKWGDTLPETGLKVGVAFSPLLAKRVGIEGEDSDEPVWAGRAVNYAAKCAQQADREQLIVTGSMWDWISNNDYLAISCDCGDPSTSIWQNVTVEKIPDTSSAAGEREGKLLTSRWCDVHGDEYCNAVLGGKHSRGANVHSLVASAMSLELKEARRSDAREIRLSNNATQVAERYEFAMEKVRRQRAARRTGLRNRRR